MEIHVHLCSQAKNLPASVLSFAREDLSQGPFLLSVIAFLIFLVLFNESGLNCFPTQYCVLASGDKIY